jgi:predicted N-acyltransferase
MAEFDIQTARSINQIDQTVWDTLVAGRPFASHRWCKFGETVLDDGRPVYIVLSQHGEPVAGAMFWLEFHDYLPVRGLMRWVLEATICRSLMTGCAPMAAASGLFLPEDSRRSSALGALLEVIEKEAQSHRASFVIFNYLPPSIAATPIWPAEYAELSFLDPGTVLEIEWPDFDSYIGQLRKSMRKDVRRHRNRAKDAGIVVHIHDDIVGNLDQAQQLFHNVEAHHNTTSRSWKRRILEHVDMVDFIWLTAEIENELVGCGLLLGDNNTYSLALLGLNYDIQYTYFQLVYAAIRAAIERGAKALRGGTDAYELKERLGFTKEPNNYMKFYARSHLIRVAIPWLTRTAMAE